MKPAHREIVRACSLPAGHPGAWIAGLALVAMASLASPAWGQSAWPSYPNNSAISVTSGGNVGIGTTTAGYKLTLSGSGSNGGGQTDVQITGTSVVGGGINLISSDTGGKNWALISTGSATGIPGSLGFYDTSVGAYRLVVSTTGNVGIGTVAPQYKLAVNGTIGAQEVIVTATGWSDYVFKPDYRLKPLKEIALYIKANHHLPEIPSEAEVQEMGVGVGDMQAKLLAKVEELTLHMIQAEERNDRMEQQNRELQGENRHIRERDRVIQESIQRMEALVNSSLESPGVKEAKQ